MGDELGGTVRPAQSRSVEAAGSVCRRCSMKTHTVHTVHTVHMIERWQGAASWDRVDGVPALLHAVGSEAESRQDGGAPADALSEGFHGERLLSPV
jgi:hypothetical protein